MAAILAEELMRRPCSLKALCLALGLRDRSTDRVRGYLEEFQRRGLVYVHSWFRSQSAFYAWQPQPWLMPNAPQPLNRVERERLRRLKAERTDKPLREAPQGVPNAPNSVFALGAM